MTQVSTIFLLLLIFQVKHFLCDFPLQGRGYMINVASAKNGVGYGEWTHFDGFSESIISFISEHEKG